MRTFSKNAWRMLAVLVVIAVIVAVARQFTGKKEENGRKTVKVVRSTIVDKALAVGTIEPENEIAVKSKISGVVQKLYADAGDYVQAGQPLLEIRPDPTPLELVEAKRNGEIAAIVYETAKREKDRVKDLVDKNLVSQREFDKAKQAFDEAEIRLKMAREKLALLEKGKVRIANTEIESIIKAPISGFVLDKSVDIGDPVVPLTSYQEGTAVMTMADMRNLVFKGTVDEIDVGKIHEGLPAEIDIGAIPGDNKIRGEVRKISLKAKKEDNITVFPIEITLTQTNGTVLRAGYSANANIIITRKDSVLAIPERVVTFRNDSAFVKILADAGTEKEVLIVTGLSDAITIEVVSGLEEGQEVLEKPVKEIK